MVVASFEKPKPITISSAILRDCVITQRFPGHIRTNKTGKNNVVLTPNQMTALCDSSDQRLLRMVDVRISHKRTGRKDHWDLSIARFSPEEFSDVV